METRLDERAPGAVHVRALTAGLAPSIAPDLARIEVHVPADPPSRFPLARAARDRLPPGFTIDEHVEPAKGGGRIVSYAVHGHASHAGVNPEGGRNALVALAAVVAAELPAGGARDLLAFARLAGQDLVGTGLGLAQPDPVFGLPTVVPTLLTTLPDGKVRLTVNIRSTPVLSGKPLADHLAARVASFDRETGATLQPGGFYDDTPLRFDPRSPLVIRLLADYARVTGKAEPPAISGGGTYAKRLPNAIAFGTWLPGKPYPGHDVDEQVTTTDLQLGARILVETLTDLACSAPIQHPFGDAAERALSY